MWKYQQPDFALLLLGELQKQQQGSIFCDTFLQTEGVCVPAHSCVLAALSPIFSRVLSTSPAPPAGKHRLISLESVGSHALLKLVSFLYTGEMEIESQSEHEDVMAAAHKLGLKNLIERKRVWVERGVEDVWRCWKEAGVQTEESVKAKESVCVPLLLERQSSTLSNANNSEAPVASVLEADVSFDESSSARGFNLISDVTVPTLTDMTEASATNHRKTKAKSRWKLRDGQLKNPTLLQNQMKQTGVRERSRNVSGKDFRKLLEAVNLPKNATSEQKETKLDKFNVKIKLRRRGTCWESNLLVSVQGESESDEVKDCGPPTPTCLSGVLPGQSLGTLTPPTDLPISPSDCSRHVSSDKLCLHTPNHSSMSSLLDLQTLSSSPPQAEESDEQIAMLLEDMFMMGLNILPLMPLDRNLDEHQMNQLDPLQEENGGAETSTDESSFYVQGCKEEIREPGFLAQTPVMSPQQRDEELKHSNFHNESRPETVKPSTQSARHEIHASLSNINKENNLETTARDSAAPLVEDLLTTSDCPLSEPSELSDFDITVVLKDRLDFKLLRCLSPLESEKADSDVPTQEPSGPSSDLSKTLKQYPETQLPPLDLDLPLRSMIDSSSPPHFNVSQDRSYPGLAKKQEFKTSLSHSDTITQCGSLVDEADDIGESPKRRMTRRHLATQRLTGKNCQNLSDESQALSKTKCDYNSHEVRTQKSTPANTNRKTGAGVKRKQESCLPLSKKMFLNITSKQHEHVDNLPKAQVTVGTVKRGRGRPKSQKCTAKNVQKCIDATKLDQPLTSFSTGSCLGQDKCTVKQKTANVPEQDNKQGQSIQEKNAGQKDVNSNFILTKQNVYLKYSGHAKRPSVIDQIFHQPSPSNACRSSLLIGRQQTLHLQDKSLQPQGFQEPLENNEDCSKLMMNNSELSSKCIYEESQISFLINDTEEVTAVDNQVRVKEGVRPVTEENSGRDDTAFQCDFQNEARKNIQDQPSEISFNALPSEDIRNDTMEIDVDHVMALSTETDSVAISNEPTVMERIDMTRIVQEMHTSVYINPDGTQAENLETKMQAAVFNEHSFVVTSDFQTVLGVNKQDTNLVADCLKNNEEEENLSRCKVVQPMNETTEGEETEVKGTNNEEVERIDLCGSDVGEKESTNGCDDDIDEEGGQYSFEIADKQTFLEEEELRTVHTANARTTDDDANAALTPRSTQVIGNTPSVQTDVGSDHLNFHSPSTENSADHSTVEITVASSVSKDDDRSDNEAIEVDVVEDPEDSALWPLAAGQIIIMPIESLQDQEVEMDVTEEEEVDVTGEDTD